MIKKSLFFVESPLQLLNTYEAIHKFALKNYEVIIRFSNNKANDTQMQYLVDYLDIRNIKYINIKAEEKNWIDYIKLLIYKYKYKLIETDKVFIGNYDSGFLKLIMKQFKKEQIVLLDDGSKTLTIQKQFSESNFYNLFTMYELETIKNQTIYKNKYEKLTEKLKQLHINHDEILFLGSKLSEIGIIEEEEYIRLIEKISSIYNDKNIIYITHRGESKNKLQKINNIKNINIKSYNFPIELLGLFEKSIPYKVASFYSTAVLSIKYLYKIDAECFLFDYSSSKYKKDIDSVYNYYSKVLKVIDIND